MAVAHVQTVKTLNHDGTSSQVSQAITVQNSGALIITGVSMFDPGSGNPTLNSSGLTIGGSSMTLDIVMPAIATTTEDHRVYLFSRPNVSSGATTIAVHRTSSAMNISVFSIEVSGAATSSPQDGIGAAATATGANPASGNFTATFPDDFWVGAFVNENGGTDATLSTGSGWSIESTNGKNSTGSAGDPIGGLEYRANPGSSGPFNGNFIAASARYSAVVFAYKAAGGAAPTPIRRSGLLTLGVG